MANSGRIVPTADGTVALSVPPTGTHFDKVDEFITTTDDGLTEVGDNTNGTDADFYDLYVMPSDMGDAIDVDMFLRIKQSGRVDDTCTWQLSVYQSDETTLIAAGDVHNIDSITSYTSFGNASVVANTDTRATWETHRTRLQKVKTASGMPDSILFNCTNVEIELNYNVATGGDGTDIPWPEVEQPRKIVIKVVASGPRPG